MPRALGHLWRLPGRRPWLAGTALALAVLAAGAGGAFLWVDYQVRAARQALERCAFDEAQRHLELCSAVPFRSAAVQLLAAQAARRRDAYDEAEQHLAACERLGGMTEATRRERVLLIAQQGDLDGMEKVLDAGKARDGPDGVPVLEALAKGYENRFWHREAVAALDALLERQPRHPQAWLLRARAWEGIARDGAPEHEPDALRDYERAVEVSPSFEARLGLAGSLYRVGRPWDASLQYEQLRRERADDPGVLLGLARCRFGLHEVDEARRLLDGLLARHPDDWAALMERGQLALHAGKLAGAEGWLRRAAAGAPPYERGPLRLLAWCLQEEGRGEEARACRDRLGEREADVHRVELLVRRANREPNDVGLRYEIAADLMRLGRREEGVAALFLVLDQEPRSAPAHAALADYFERTGQPRRAARHRRAGPQPTGAPTASR